MIRFRNLWIAVALVAIPACDLSNEPMTPAPHVDLTPPVVPILPMPIEGRSAQPADMRPSAPSEAVDAIATARCERETRCGHVGEGATFVDTSSCELQIRADWRTELSAYACPGGIERDELTECLVEIRNEDCASPFDSLERVVACRSSDICNAT